MAVEDIHNLFKQLLRAFTKQNVDVLLDTDNLFVYDACNKWQPNLQHPLFQINQFRFLLPPLVDQFLQLPQCKAIPFIKQSKSKAPTISSVDITEVIGVVDISFGREFEKFVPDLTADLITSVAGEKYENRDGEGLCAVFSSEQLDYSSILSGFYRIDAGERKEFVFNSIHAHRKFLNLSSQGKRRDIEIETFQPSRQCLVYERKKDGGRVRYELIGFAEREDALAHFPGVLFSSHSQWEFSLPLIKLKMSKDGELNPISELKPQSVAVYRDGHYCFPDFPLEAMEEEWLRLNLPTNITTIQRTNAYNILQAAKKQKSGTLVILSESQVISTIAKTVHLSQMGIRMDPSTPLDLANNTKYLDNFSVIDGAVLMDFDGLCHAVGAIIGGEPAKGSEKRALMEGDIGRGSRYNSARSFIDWASKRYKGIFFLAIVVSEDGIVDLLRTHMKP